jgi:DNA helicase-2/ATP-dependent DNA helicase PcrA
MSFLIVWKDERLLYVSLTRALRLEYIIEKDEVTKLI